MSGALAEELPDDVQALQALVEQQAAALRHERAERHKSEALVAARDATIDQLKAHINLLLSRRYGASSERVGEAQLGLFNEAEALAAEGEHGEDGEAGTEVAGHRRKVPKRRPLPEHLPRVDIEHELPEAERHCPEHDVVLERFGEEVSEQLDIVPATVRVLRHVRGKYRCPDCEGRLVTAPMPAQPIPKSLASPGLLAHIAVGKFVDGLPLYRQHQQLMRIGMELSRVTVAMWMVRVGELVQPLINLMRERLLAEDYLLMDETTVQVLKEPGKAAESKSYLWVQMNTGPHRTVLFDYDPSRSSEVPVRLLEGFAGALHTDGYRGYDGVVDSQDLTRLYCFAHARRKFVEVLKSLGLNPKKLPPKPPPEARNALKAIGFIKTLYVIERRLKNESPEERYRQRQRDALPVLEKLRAWLTKIRSRGRILDSSKMGKALAYLDNHWDGLIGYCDDGRYGIDTNPVENAIRPFCVGRRAWLFSDSVAGAKASANLYSLVETAKANGIDPYAYLRHVFTELPKATTVEDIEALLPASIDPAKLTTT